MTFRDWIAAARLYAHKHYAWGDVHDLEAMMFHYENGATPQEAIDTEAQELGLEPIVGGK
jgi:hypothetical protein